MGFVRNAIDTVDRGGLRWLLSLGCNVLSTLRGEDLKIKYQGNFWYFSSAGMTLPRGPKFDFYDWDLRNLPGRIRRYQKEAEDCWFFAYQPKSGDVIVDVGAEIGTDCVIFSRAVGPDGSVIAIEAQPDTYRTLLKTCEANGLANVNPIHLAIADRPRTVRISSDAGVESNFLGASGVEVQADTLDHILADTPHIDLLKMNIEGAEQLAIMGMDATVEKTDYLAIACHDFVADSDWFRTLEKVATYLKSKGFSVRRREDDPRPYAKYHLHAISPKVLHQKRAANPA